VPSIQWYIIIICILASLVGGYNVRCCSEMTSQESLFASVKMLSRVATQVMEFNLRSVKCAS
jgi:hypothetical protein